MERQEELATMLRTFGSVKLRACLQTTQQLQGPLPRGAMTEAAEILGVARSSLRLWLEGYDRPSVEAAIGRLSHPSQDVVTDQFFDRAAEGRRLARPVPLAPHELISLLPMSEETMDSLRYSYVFQNMDADSVLGMLLPLVPERFARMLWEKAGIEEARKKEQEIEATAKTIYDGWADQKNWVPWRPGGNSIMQDLARSQARETA